jgi:hypothetical protein
MATADQQIGRREGVGIGIEATPGTSVAPQVGLRWLDQGLQNKTNVIENNSATGVVEGVNDSAITSAWAEGAIGGKVTSEAIGFLLLGMFGTVTTGAASSGIYPHTFSVRQSSIPKALTFTVANSLETNRYSYGVVDTFELSAEAGDWVKVNVGVKARKGATSVDTIVYSTTELEFTSKQITVKLAANAGALAAAAALKVASVKLNLGRPSEQFDALGTNDAPEFDRGTFKATGEIVIRYTDTQYETDYLANTPKALQVTMANGTTSLAFTATQIRYRELERSRDKDSIVTQTLGFTCEFDTSANKTIEPVLKNSRATYESA